MDGSNLPLPLKRQSLMDALNSTRGLRTSSIQFKHSPRDPGGKLGPSSRRVDRPQVAGDHLKRRTGHGSKKSNLPFSLNGSKVGDLLCTADTCVPVTPEGVVPGKVRAGSTTLMKSRLLQLHERNRLIEARRRLDRCRLDPDVTGMTSPTGLKIDADDVTGNGSLPGGCSAIGPAYHDELGSGLEGGSIADDGHTYQSIGELLRDEVSKPEVRRAGSPLPATDPGAKQVRSKSRSIFSKLWNLRRTQQAIQKDTASSKPFTTSNTTSSTCTPPVENKQPSQNSTEAVQKLISSGSRDSFALDSKNNFRSTMTSSGNDDVTGNDREMSPDSIDDHAFHARKNNTVEKYRIHSVFADKSSVSHRQKNSVEHSAILTQESKREPDVNEDCLSSRWNKEISNKTRAFHRGNASENLCQISSTIGKLDIVGESLSSKSHNVQFDRIKPISTTFYGIWPIAGLHESSPHDTCFPTGSPMGLVIGKVAHRLRFSSPCCGVRMAEMRAVWRKCEVVALISTDAVYSRHSLATRQNNEDFAWKLLREDASRLLSKEPNYFSSSCSAQTERGVAQEHEFTLNGRLLSKRTSKGNEYVESISNQTQAVDSKENDSKRERNWTIDDFKLSEYYAGPNKTDDSFATAGNLKDAYEMKSPCKETKANESKLKQPKSTKYNTSIVQVARVGRNNSARTNNSVATKPNLLQTKQQSKEQNIYKNTGSDRVTSPISAESSDEQHQSQVKQAFVRYIETAATPVTPASASQPERSFSSHPGDPEIPTLKSGSCIPRMRFKTNVQTTETDNDQSTAVETSHSPLHHETGFRSVENPQDERSSYPEHSRVELMPYENVLESDLRESGSPLLSRLLETSAPSSAIKERTAKEEEDEEQEDEELEFQEIKACASLSHTPYLSTSEPKTLPNNSRYVEINCNEISADSCAVLRPPPGVGPCTHSGNKDVDPLEDKRRRGKSQIVAPRTDAARCRQQIERFRLEAENHAKHEIHQNL